MSGLRRDDNCETADGPGRVITIENANRWHPRARIIVELDDGRRRAYVGGQVWASGEKKGA